MSDFLVAAALWLDLSTARKMVLVSLCENADRETGFNFPNQDYIAARCSLSERSVREHLHALEADKEDPADKDSGWIRTARVGRGYGSRTERYVNVKRIERIGRARHDAFMESRRARRIQPAEIAGNDGNEIDASTIQPAPDAGLNRQSVPLQPASPAGFNRKPTSDDPSGDPSGDPSSEKSEPPYGPPARGGTDRASLLWKEIKSGASARMTKEQADRWLADTRALRIEDLDDELRNAKTVLFVEAPPTSIEWLTGRFAPLIRASAGKTIDVVFEAAA